MPSNKETLFQDHICSFLEQEHGYRPLADDEKPENEHHIILPQLVQFVRDTQPQRYKELHRQYGSSADMEILKAIEKAIEKRPLWLAIRKGIEVRGITIELYKPKPRTGTPRQWERYRKNIFTFKKEYRYNPKTEERIDLVIWLNGLPIVVCEMKHEDKGQNVEDAIHESFLKRELGNDMYQLPFLYLALSNTEAKVATNPEGYDSFRWFNADLVNKAETEGEYPVEHVYRYALAKENIAKYLEHYLLYVPPKEEDGAIVEPSVTIFPRYHQLRASKKIARRVKNHFESSRSLGLTYLINHSAGSGKTLTIAWMADLLDSVYTNDGEKIFDNVIILTDRRSLDKNVREELDRFSHLKETKFGISEESEDLANYLDEDKDIIASTIHKFSYIQDKLDHAKKLKDRNVAFLIDEAHRSQDGKLALSMQQTFTDMKAEDEDELGRLDISNQVYVAFTATTTKRTNSFFGEPIDTYSEEEAIAEGYILDVAQSIITYNTLYHLDTESALPDKTFPKGTLSQMLKRKAYEDDSLIQYKSEIIVNMFENDVMSTIDGRGKAMVVAMSRKAGLRYYKHIQTIIEEKELPFGVLYAFSEYTDEETGEELTEEKLNDLDGKDIEDVFDTEDYRIMVVANKFQTGFDQPLLSSMFLDKPIKGINAIQTVSRLNRDHPDKNQSDLLVVDFTNSADEIFDAFNKHREGSPFTEEEPDKELLDDLYKQIIELEIFSEEEIVDYVKEYKEAERAARNREATPDAILSNVNQDYRKQFREALPQAQAQKDYVALLNRYCKLYYFMAKFFEFEEYLRQFITFAEAMRTILMNRGKGSELANYLEEVETERIVVTEPDVKENPNDGDTITGGGSVFGGGGNEPSRATIDEMLDDLREKFEIDEREAIVIKEICEEVSENEEVTEPISKNRNNNYYLINRAKPKVEGKVRDGYINREMYDKLEDPMYTDKGGIISLMGKTIINRVLSLPN